MIVQAVKDFASAQDGKRKDVARWTFSVDFDAIATKAGLEPQVVRRLFSELAALKPEKRALFVKAIEDKLLVDE